MSKFIHHDEYEMIRAAAKAYRDRMAGTIIALPLADDEIPFLLEPGQTFADRIEQALRGTDWRRVEAREGT